MADDARQVKHQEFRSSNLKSAAYDSATHELHVIFQRSPEVHVYQQVPPNVGFGLFTAPSAGEYFHQHIRGQYEYTK